MFDIGRQIWGLIEKIAYALLRTFFYILGKELTDKVFESFMQFVKFGIVGLSNTVLSYLIYVVGLVLLRKLGLFSRTDYIIASVIGFILSVYWSFYWNHKMVFKLRDGQERSWWKALIKTYISYSFTGLFLSNILLILWVQVCHISEMIAPLINLLVTVPLNFLINKFWAFRGK